MFMHYCCLLYTSSTLSLGWIGEQRANLRHWWCPPIIRLKRLSTATAVDHDLTARQVIAISTMWKPLWKLKNLYTVIRNISLISWRTCSIRKWKYGDGKKKSVFDIRADSNCTTLKTCRSHFPKSVCVCVCLSICV